MKQKIERRRPEGLLDFITVAITTFGVGYIPFASGTFGSMVGIGIYLATEKVVNYFGPMSEVVDPAAVAWIHSAIFVSFLIFSLAGIWAAGRSTSMFGNSDPSEAVVDEVIGQLIVFLFVPFAVGWQFILAGFLLFRLFDIWKPYPIDDLQDLHGGLGVCADDILAGVYAGIVLSIIYAISVSL